MELRFFLFLFYQVAAVANFNEGFVGYGPDKPVEE